MRPLVQRLVSNATHPMRYMSWLMYQRIRPEADYVLATLPSSGTHWLRLMLASLVVSEFRLDEELGDLRPTRIVPTFFDKSDRFRYHLDRSIPRIQHTHRSYRKMFRRRGVILLIRDLRDACVSQYDVLRKSGRYRHGFSDFLRGHHLDLSRHSGLPGRVKFLNAWGDHLGEAKKSVVVTYEQLVNSTQRQLTVLLSFLGLSNISDFEVNKIIFDCSIGKMRRLAAANQSGAAYSAIKINEGVVNRYVKYFSDSDYDYFAEYIRKKLRHSFSYDYFK